MAEEQDGHVFKLIVGLGNPGRRYENTRHNVGFHVVEKLVGVEGATWTFEKRWNADLAKGEDCYYLKPQTFMNLSGKAVAGIANFFKISPAEVLVVFDDVDLPLGGLRLRTSGSAGGHRGVKSIISSLGTDKFARCKVGVGRGEEGQGDLADHVLCKFQVEEQPVVEKSLDRTVAAVKDAVSHGMRSAMAEYNRKSPLDAPQELESGESASAAEKGK